MVNRPNPDKWPKKIWAAGINLNGLWFINPIRMTLQKEWVGSYWDKNGEFGVKQLGLLYETMRTVTFGSADQKEVQWFIEGANAIRQMACDAIVGPPPRLNKPAELSTRLTLENIDKMYDPPDGAYRQAFQNGQEAFRKVILDSILAYPDIRC